MTQNRNKPDVSKDIEPQKITQLQEYYLQMITQMETDYQRVLAYMEESYPAFVNTIETQQDILKTVEHLKILLKSLDDC
ncbi:MAG: hypothetical protein F6K08_16625 [Okeania sp. SIO1H6]|nr:hypothetical protein [Okeania sp. SIO1H6]